MSDIVFVSETGSAPELELAKSEIAQHGYSVSSAIKFDKVVYLLKNSSINIVLINAMEMKLEAYDLCRDIKDKFRGSIKVFVYLPQASVNEGSKFGQLNAEVEDEASIHSIVDKLHPKKHRDYILEENTTAIYGINGGIGVSFIAVLLSYVLNNYKQTSLLIESGAFSIRNMLDLEAKHALLSRDRSKEINQIRDPEWFNAFLARTELIPKAYYLNLFDSFVAYNQYLDNPAHFATCLSQQVAALTESSSSEKDMASTIYGPQELKNKLLGIVNSLKLLAKDLEGDSYTLFDEIIQLGSKFSQNIIFDLSGDIFSTLNRQLLRFSKNLIIVFRDSYDMKHEYLERKDLLLSKYNLNIIPVLAPGYYHYSKYKNLSNDEWMDVLGDVPLIYPYEPELVTRFIYEKEKILSSTSLFKFANDLLLRSSFNIEEKLTYSNKQKGVLRFLDV